MAISSVAKTFRDGVLLIEDATATTTLSLNVKYEDGDFSAEGFSTNQAEILSFFDRGDLYSLRKGNQTFPTFSFSAHMTDLSDAAVKLIWDLVRATNSMSAMVSTYGASAEVKTYKLTWTVEGTDHGDSTDHTLVLDDCYLNIGVAEGSPSKFSVSGTVYGTIAAT